MAKKSEELPHARYRPRPRFGWTVSSDRSIQYPRDAIFGRVGEVSCARRGGYIRKEHVLLWRMKTVFDVLVSRILNELVKFLKLELMS